MKRRMLVICLAVVMLFNTIQIAPVAAQETPEKIIFEAENNYNPSDSDTDVEEPSDSDSANLLASGTCGANATWKLTDDGVLTISGSGRMNSTNTWQVFRHSIEKVIIEEGIISIGDFAFSYCSTLTSIEIPSSVTSIYENAFRDCIALTSIEIPDSVTSIYESAFRGCSALISIEIPASVTIISESVFEGCSALTSIEIPSSVTSIYESAFGGCSALTSIEIPDSVTYIGESAFEGCSALTSIEIPSSVTSIEDDVFCDCRALTSIKIPANVTSIGDKAFAYCRSLTSIEIPASVTSIGDRVFDDCRFLTIYGIPGSYAETYARRCYISFLALGEIASGTCGDNLTWKMKEDGTLTISGSGKMDSYVASSSVPWCEYRGDITVVEIKEGVTSIGKYSFCNCSALTSIEIPGSVTSIESYAFFGCSSLTSVKIPACVTYIGVIAFGGCNSLTMYGIHGSYAETYASENDIAFSPIYIGNINSELISFDLKQTDKGAYYLTGQIVVVEWVGDVSTVPKDTPIMTFKSTDGAERIDVFVTPTGTNTYYFDRFIEGLSADKEYVFEIASGNAANHSPNRSMNVSLATSPQIPSIKNLGKIGEQKISYYQADNGELRLHRRNSTYVGNINSELIKTELVKGPNGNYVSGQIVVVEWENGVSTVPFETPIMYFKSTDGTESLPVFVTPTGTNTYYFDRSLGDMDTTKEYVFTIASGDSLNVSPYKSMIVTTAAMKNKTGLLWESDTQYVRYRTDANTAELRIYAVNK